jgi:hypothetical protein
MPFTELKFCYHVQKSTTELLSEPRHFRSHDHTDRCKEPVYNLYGYTCGVPIIQVIKSRVCGTYGRQARCIQGFGGETCGKRTTWKTKALDGRVILKWIFKMWDGGLD